MKIGTLGNEKMKITKIETIRIPEHPNLIWIKIHTDEGIIGLGESWFGACFAGPSS